MWITSTFNALGAYSRFKATAGKPVTITIEFDNLPYADTWINGPIPGMFGGIGSNERPSQFDGGIFVPLVDFVDSPRKFKFQTTITFPVARSQAWIVIGFYHNYHGTDIQQANQYSMVLPFIVDGNLESLHNLLYRLLYFMLHRATRVIPNLKVAKLLANLKKIKLQKIWLLRGMAQSSWVTKVVSVL
ncbi:MAG: hypothetical protein MUF45_04600 [Spirosomaceae bacterium]|nr:hypothetical protein [Spirosomataceae bacterium]